MIFTKGCYKSTFVMSFYAISKLYTVQNCSRIFFTTCVFFNRRSNLLRNIPSILSPSDHFSHPGQAPPTFSPEIFRPVLSFLRNITVSRN